MKNIDLFLFVVCLAFFSTEASAQKAFEPRARQTKHGDIRGRLSEAKRAKILQHYGAEELAAYEKYLSENAPTLPRTKKTSIGKSQRPSHYATDLSEFMEFTAHPSSAILEDNIFPLGLDNDELVMFYRVISWETGADSLFAARSMDAGLSWQSPQLIFGSETWAYDGFRGHVTASGRIVLSFYQWGELGPLVYLFHSDDHGATWSAPVESALPAFGTFSTINDSTLWYTYIDDETGNVHYRTSEDDGISWGEDRLMVEADDLYDHPLVVPGNGSTLYLYFSAPSEELAHRRSFLNQLFQRTSTDGGATWSSAVSLSPIDMAFVNGQGPAEFYPRRQSDGTLWIFYVAAALKEVESPFGGTGYQATEDWNVFYRTSADGGQTWGAPQQFTRYSGKDIGAQSTVVNDQLFVLFNTSRWQPVQTDNTYLYGVPGITQDSNPPPTGRPRREWLATAQNQKALLQFEAFDESGLSKVEGFYQINDGATIGPVQLNDNGANGDQVAGDGMWSGYLGEMNFGDTATSYCQITDTDGNTVTMEASAYTVFPYHTVGNVTLLMTEEGLLGGSDYGFRSDAQGHWPRENGHDYLWYGGLWVGSDIGGTKRVMQPGFPDNSDWQPTVGSQITTGTDISDQDLGMHYDDLNTPRLDEHQPIGLKIHQESFQWADSTKDDFLIFRYTMVNTGLNSDLTDVVAALYMGLAVHNDNPRYEFGKMDDMVGFDPERNLFYMFDAEGDPETHVGVKILSGHDLLAIETETNWDLETDDDYYDYISMGKGIPTEPREGEKIILSTRLSGLATGDYTATIAFGLVFGESLAAMQANADTMDAVFKSLNFPTRVDHEFADGLPQSYALQQNYPNPFNPGTQISFDLPKSGQVDVSIFNISGQLVKRLINGKYQAGSHAVVWDGRDDRGRFVTSGLYFYTIRSADFVQTKRMIKLK